MLETVGLSYPALGYCLPAVFAAGLIRGYSGFGLSALLMTSLVLVLPPSEIVPVTLLLEVFATLLLLRGIRGDVDWRIVQWLCLGAAIATPTGVILLTRLSPDSIRLVLSVLVLCACVLLWRGVAIAGRGMAPAFATGIISGVVNGAAAVGGLPAVIFLMAAVPRAAAFRATAMVFLLLLNGYGFAAASWAGLVDGQALARLGLFALPALAGVFLGHRRFLAANPDSFRRFAIVLMAALAVIGIAKILVTG